MGDWSLFVRGTSVAELNGALVVETNDEAASGRFIDAIARLARKRRDGDEPIGPLQRPGGGEGVTLRTPDVPEPIHLFQRDGKVVLAYGDAAAADAARPAREAGRHRRSYTDAQEALGGDYDLSFYVGGGADPRAGRLDGRGRRRGLAEGQALPGAARRAGRSAPRRTATSCARPSASP